MSTWPSIAIFGGDFGRKPDLGVLRDVSVANYEAILAHLRTPRRAVIRDWAEFVHPHSAPDDPHWFTPVGWGPCRTMIDRTWPLRQRVMAALVATDMVRERWLAFAAELRALAADAATTTTTTTTASLGANTPLGAVEADALDGPMRAAWAVQRWLLGVGDVQACVGFAHEVEAMVRIVERLELPVALTVARPLAMAAARAAAETAACVADAEADAMAFAVDSAAHAGVDPLPVFYARWWVRVRARMAFFDAPIADLE